MIAVVQVPSEVLEAYTDTGLGKILAHNKADWVSIHYVYKKDYVEYRMSGDETPVKEITAHLHGLMAKYDAEHRRHSSSDTGTTVGQESNGTELPSSPA